jgi:hypothetical protein
MLFYFLKTRQKELQAHGRTSDRNSEESFEQDADDVSGLLDFLKVEKRIFLTSAMGAIQPLPAEASARAG